MLIKIFYCVKIIENTIIFSGKGESAAAAPGE